MPGFDILGYLTVMLVPQRCWFDDISKQNGTQIADFTLPIRAQIFLVRVTVKWYITFVGARYVTALCPLNA